MVRFKVVKGSHLLLAIAALILAAVLVFILVQELSDDPGASIGAGTANAATMLGAEEEAKAQSVFASAASDGLVIESGTITVKAADDQISFADVGADEVSRILRETDLNTLTPIEAMNLLFELQKKARG